MKNYKRVLSFLLIASMLVLLPSFNAFAEEKTVVRFGLLPYQDWMPWMLAEELGYFDEVGIDFQVTTFTDDITCAEAIAAGDIDIGCGNSGSGPLALSRFPSLRVISCTCGFLGYAIMVRPDDVVANGGSVKTYADLYAENLEAGMDESAAQEQAIVDACAQLKGKTIVMDRGTGSNLPLNAALAAAGLTTSDVAYMDISDVEGALAFLDGTGDFELGGFPQVTSLSENGCFKLISAMELGGQSVNLSAEMATAEYVENNMDTIAKLRKVWFKTVEQIYSDDTSYMQKLADVTSSYTGSTYTLEDMVNTAENIDPWPTIEEASDIFLKEDGKWSFMEIYGGSLDYWINNQKQVKEGSVDLQKQLDVLIAVQEAAQS